MTYDPYFWAVFAPLLGFLTVGVFGYGLGKKFSALASCTLMALAAYSGGCVFYDIVLQGAPTKLIPLMTWISVGQFHVKWALYYDVLSALMVSMVTFISFLIHVYSTGYMHDDPHLPRFMAYLSLFTFMMLMLVVSDNLVQLFFGWEGVGVASYLLIGFWYYKDSANAAAMKAFIVNRIGDLAFILGIGAIFYTFDSVEFLNIFSSLSSVTDDSFKFLGYEFSRLEVIGVLLFIGAMGKSAQLGLHTWLPDAMEGPTPVSALIHAATMVTAGVFLVCRMSPLYELAPHAKTFIIIIGASTAFFAGTIAITQNDIKRVIAYSTCSQLGYMFLAAGLGAYNIAIFHLLTHAFFKALLFLGAGSIIHAMSDEQDMRRMGGIWRGIPVTYVVMWIGSLALAGIPFFAGYYSKDAILEAAWMGEGLASNYGYLLGIAAAFMTAFYSWRVLLLTFTGTPRADDKVMSHLHEPGLQMMLPLMVLSIGAIFAGYAGFDYVRSPEFWNHALTFETLGEEEGHALPTLVHFLPIIAAFSGIGLAYIFYYQQPKLPAFIAHKFQSLYAFSLNKWYFDEAYQRVFVSPAQKIGSSFWMQGDGKIIDGYGPDGVSQKVVDFAKRMSSLQSGYVYHYAFVFIAGFVSLILYAYFWN